MTSFDMIGLDDKDQSPGSFFYVSVVYKSEVIVIAGESGLFASRDI
jgi:hypothetical protein